MLALALALIVSQTPSIPPEVVQKYEAERGPVLEALAARYKCQKPRKAPEPMCDVALSEQNGTAADIRGENALVGLSWFVKRGKGGKVEVGAPMLSALLLKKDSVGVWGGITNITPQDAAEKRMLAQLTKDYEALLRGKRSTVALPKDVSELLPVVLKVANNLVEKKDNAWVFKGTPGALRKVGERWVMLGAPRIGEGIVVGVFVPQEAGGP
jgi:hypothetical protein